MNTPKTGIIVALLVVIIGMGTLLVADVINIPGLIQNGSYFDNITHITLPNQSSNMSLQAEPIEDYYSAKVADLYQVDTIIYDAGNVEFAYNLDEDNQFIDGYITYSSARTANLQTENQQCEDLAHPDYCLTEEQYNDLTSDIPEIEEVSKEEYNSMSKQEQEAMSKQEQETEDLYEQALSEYKVEEQAQSAVTSDDIIVDYYTDVNSFNNAISDVIGIPTTYQDLDQYKA